MAEREIDRKIRIMTENWVAIGKFEAPIEWEAWTDWRRINLGCVNQPDTLTVPTDFPPATDMARRQYMETIDEIRRSIGWVKKSALAPRAKNYPANGG